MEIRIDGIDTFLLTSCQGYLSYLSRDGKGIWKTMKLEQLLEDFKKEMLSKMIAVAPKNKSNTVTDDDFTWKTYPLSSVELHLIDEFAEWIKARTHQEFQGEDIDLANLAFIHWTMLKARDASWRFRYLMNDE